MYNPSDVTNAPTQTGLRQVWPVLLGCLFVAALLLQPALNGRAQEPTPTDDEVNRIARNLYCPVCENTPLDVCPTEACRQWRDVIREKLTEGWSQKQIEAYFVEQYGARVLAEPPRTGLNWLVYVLPLVIIAAGAVVVFRAFRAWKTAGRRAAGQRPAGSQNSVTSDEYVRRLEEELKRRG